MQAGDCVHWLKKKTAILIKEWLSDLNDIPRVLHDANILEVIKFSPFPSALGNV